jgi:hypothetical protein
MKQRTQRKHLLDYTVAAKNLELSEVAINVLEGVNTSESRIAIRALKRGQQKQLKLLDAAAEKLGAPYGA